MESKKCSICFKPLTDKEIEDGSAFAEVIYNSTKDFSITDYKHKECQKWLEDQFSDLGGFEFDIG